MNQAMFEPIKKQLQEGDLLLAMTYLRAYTKLFELEKEFSPYHLISSEALSNLKGKGKVSLKELKASKSPMGQYQWVMIDQTEGIKPMTTHRVLTFIEQLEAIMVTWTQERWFLAMERLIINPHPLLSRTEAFQVLERWHCLHFSSSTRFFKLIDNQTFERFKQETSAKTFWFQTRGITDIHAPILQSPTGMFRTLDETFLQECLNTWRPRWGSDA